MYLVYQEISRSVPTIKELTGSLDQIKSRVSALIGVKLSEGTIKPIYCCRYAEIYSDDSVRLCELVRVGNSSFDWVDLNPLII